MSTPARQSHEVTSSTKLEVPRQLRRNCLLANMTATLVSSLWRVDDEGLCRDVDHQVGDSQAASQAIHIGDSLPADVQGATDAKLAAAILVNRWHKPLPRAGPYPTHMVEHVTELPRILKALQAAD